MHMRTLSTSATFLVAGALCASAFTSLQGITATYSAVPETLRTGRSLSVALTIANATADTLRNLTFTEFADSGVSITFDSVRIGSTVSNTVQTALGQLSEVLPGRRPVRLALSGGATLSIPPSQSVQIHSTVISQRSGAIQLADHMWAGLAGATVPAFGYPDSAIRRVAVQPVGVARRPRDSKYQSNQISFGTNGLIVRQPVSANAPARATLTVYRLDGSAALVMAAVYNQVGNHLEYRVTRSQMRDLGLADGRYLGVVWAGAAQLSLVFTLTD